MKNLFVLPLVAAAVFAISGCTTDPYTGEQRVSKAAIGAITGAAIGAAVSSKKDRKKGALIGATLGGGTGYYFDRQEQILRQKLQSTGVSVTRTPEGGIKLNMPGNVSFPTNQYTLLASFYQVLDSVGLVLKEFDKTRIKVSGYTDSRGSEAYNQTLSEKRAASVMSYFLSQGIPQNRLEAYGYGEQYPIATNDTAVGRSENRRVELEILNY